ncbi:hypothetical protein IWQ62_001831 [Dispira parvispora]|uniref:Dynactin subunit 3 n=1 Tax=Dispira parvispora TaxID=1520584 RepID=A0A9W8AX05_9FUNG|nr:hypothetical protein IWQ62_001831 [Dispira parvispora]
MAATSNLVEMDHLELRLRRLEHTLRNQSLTSTARSEAPTNHSSVVERVVTNKATFHSLTKRVLFIEEFLRNYDHLKPLLKTHSTEFATDQLTTEAKLEIIQHAYPDITQVAEHLQEIQALEKYVNDPAYQQVVQAKPEVQSLLEGHAEQGLAFRQLSNQLTHLLDTYNATVQAISEMFLIWDKTLQQLETKVKALESNA